ncbi:MAG: hypothetical protein HRT94_00840 [Alphaproteobacteria bacterium]|nr:hypothetical protein [Alphaproteobacteria bacterium]
MTNKPLDEIIEINASKIANMLFNLRRAEEVIVSNVITGYEEFIDFASQAALAKKNKNGSYDVQLRMAVGRRSKLNQLIATDINLQEVFQVFVRCANEIGEYQQWFETKAPPGYLLRPDEDLSDHANYTVIPFLSSSVFWHEEESYFRPIKVTKEAPSQLQRYLRGGYSDRATHMTDHPEFKGYEAYSPL